MIDTLGKLVSSGSYGEIYVARLAKARGDVAVKRMLVISDSDFGFSYREADICLKFGKHPNICGASILYASTVAWPTKPGKGTRCDIISLAMPLALGDLYHLCQEEVLSEVQIKHITAQILLALECLHRNGYIHRDIKPTNVLHFKGHQIRVCDFGISKRYFPYDDHNHIAASDYFRPPEALALIPSYGYGIDIWSLGCTVHFMHTNSLPCPEWDKEKGPYTCIAQVQDIIDSLPYEVSPDTLSDDPIGRHLNYDQKTTHDQFFVGYRADVKSTMELSEFLLGGMLMFDQRLRLSARDLLNHPYLSGVESLVTRVRPSSMNLNVGESAPTKLRGRRGCCADLMRRTLAECSHLDWYKDKVLFTAIEMFDRALYSIVQADPKISLTEFEVQRYYRACLYIAAKYYSASVDCDLRFSVFPFPDITEGSVEKDTELELYIVRDALKERIYRMSIYDVALNHRRPRRPDVLSLLEFVISGSHNGLTPEEAYARWEDQQLAGR